MSTKDVYLLKRVEKIDGKVLPDVILNVYFTEDEAKDALKSESRRWDRINWDRHVAEKSIVFTWMHDEKVDFCVFMITKASLVEP